jgi:dimethylamine monooxygenase subunit C
MLITGIKSKPVYAPLRADIHGRYHVMLGQAAGREPLLRVLRELEESAPSALKNTRVYYVPAPGGGDPRGMDCGQNAGPDGRADADERIVREQDDPAADARDFSDEQIAELRRFERVPALLEEFAALAGRCLMGTRLYVAGPESFIGLVMKIALEFNLNQDEIRAEECGSRARRVFCIHCRATTEDVKTNIVACVGCARWLLVRDHYSRRLAAYMGVMADAEAPGELPVVKEVFL